MISVPFSFNSNFQSSLQSFATLKMTVALSLFLSLLAFCFQLYFGKLKALGCLYCLFISKNYFQSFRVIPIHHTETKKTCP